MASEALFILFVRDQRAAAEFYASVLGVRPSLDVPGMTEFVLGERCKLGLMPARGIQKLLGDALPDMAPAQGIPRSELYLLVEDPEALHRKALEHGATELSPLSARDWGDQAAYSLDPDGHILAFAKRSHTA